MLKALLDGFTDVTKDQDDKQAELVKKRGELRGLDYEVDQTPK